MIVYSTEETFNIKPEDFAPGIWAGSEGQQWIFIIKSVDLNKREIVMSRILRIEDGI